jgi:hypothetical protein
METPMTHLATSVKSFVSLCTIWKIVLLADLSVELLLLERRVVSQSCDYQCYSVKMDRFVTRTEAFLIPKTVEYDDVDIYESLVRRVNEVLDDTGEDDRNPNEVIGIASEADRNPDEVAGEVAPKQPIGKRAYESHSPGISEQGFAPLNRSQVETLEEIGNVLIKALREVNICRGEPESKTATSREGVKKAKCDLEASESTDESSDDGSDMYLYPSKGRLGHSEVS